MNKSSTTSLKYEELTPLTHLHYQSNIPPLCDLIPLTCKVDSALPCLFTPSFWSIKPNRSANTQGAWKPRQLVSVSRYGAVQGNCIFKVPIGVRQESRQNDWLPFSPWEHHLEQKNLIIKPLTQKQSKLMASYDYELKPVLTSSWVPRHCAITPDWQVLEAGLAHL